MDDPILERGLAVLAFSRKALLGIVDEIPDDKLTHAAAAGTNHPLWIMNHLAWADDYFATQLGKRPSVLPAKLTELVGMGSSPKPDAKLYPSRKETLNNLGQARESLTGWLRSMDAAKLRTNMEGDMAQFGGTFGGLMFAIAWHEGLHTGQLSVVRRSLGLKPKFG